MAWVRLWDDMPTDPKWRAIARRSGQRIGDVMAVFNFMLVRAGENDGSIEGWDDEDVGAAIDLDAEHVAAIRDAMQGKVLDGEMISAWEKRQPKRQDDSKERVRKHRELKRREEPVTEDVTQCNAPVTQCNAPDTDTDTDNIPPIPPKGFKAFWDAFPNKVGKGAAEKAFKAASKRVDLETMLAGLERYKRTKPPERPWCNPATWLNQDRWTDEPAEPDSQAIFSEALSEAQEAVKAERAASAEAARIAAKERADRRVQEMMERHRARGP